MMMSHPIFRDYNSGHLSYYMFCSCICKYRTSHKQCVRTKQAVALQSERGSRGRLRRVGQHGHPRRRGHTGPTAGPRSVFFSSFKMMLVKVFREQHAERRPSCQRDPVKTSFHTDAAATELRETTEWLESPPPHPNPSDLWKTVVTLISGNPFASRNIPEEEYRRKSSRQKTGFSAQLNILRPK